MPCWSSLSLRETSRVIMRTGIESIYPLSPMQEGILFHSLSAPHLGMYIVQDCHAISGELDIRAFHRAWQEMVDRHSILRSVFIWQDQDRWLQVVYRRARIALQE